MIDIIILIVVISIYILYIYNDNKVNTVKVQDSVIYSDANTVNNSIDITIPEIEKFKDVIKTQKYIQLW